MTAADEILTQTSEQKEQEKLLQADLDAVTQGLEEEKPRKRKRRKRRTKAEMEAAKATIANSEPKKRGRKPSKKSVDPVAAAPVKTQVFKLAGLPKSVKVVENKRGIVLTTSVEKKVVIKGSEITMTSSINGVKKVNVFSRDEIGAKAFSFVVSTFF